MLGSPSVDPPWHQPVMVREVMDLLRPEPGALLLDATLGDGGHAQAWLQSGGRVIGFDRDPVALQRAKLRLKHYEERLTVFCLSFSRLEEQASSEGHPRAAILDLGTSRAQIEEASRGFSYLEDGPLDMRMDPRHGDPLSVVLRRTPRDELAGWLAIYGDVQAPRRVARAILSAGPPETTGELADAVSRLFPPRRRIRDIAKVFQALRMAINDEQTELAKGLQTIVDVLRPGGRVAVLTYHSGEERAVRMMLRRFSGQCICPPGMPVCGCGVTERVELLRPLGQRPHREEVAANPRSRSARLWAGQKLYDA